MSSKVYFTKDIVGRGLAPAANAKIPSTITVEGIGFSNQFYDQSISTIDVSSMASVQK